jgi:hypothetical protein
MGIPEDQVIILLRHEQFNVRVEYLNMDWCRPKKISEMRSKITHGHCLFVEQNEIKKTPFDKLSWYRCMMMHESLFKLYISFEERSIQISINKTKTLEDLKNKIGKEINVAPEYFNLKRMGVVKELKDLTLTLP